MTKLTLRDVIVNNKDSEDRLAIKRADRESGRIMDRPGFKEAANKAMYESIEIQRETIRKAERLEQGGECTCGWDKCDPMSTEAVIPMPTCPIHGYEKSLPLRPRRVPVSMS